jgi:ferredoxin
VERPVPDAYPKNAPGPFYVENECCVTCGIPLEVAPDLFTWDEEKGEFDNHCFLRRQPSTSTEVGRVVEAMRQTEMECIRYRGDDAALRKRLVDEGFEDQCD